MTWALAISILALLVSAYTLWSNIISGPSLIVTPASRITLTVDPRTNPLKPAVIVPFLVSNKGARPGYVLDVAVKLSAASRTETLRTIYELENERMQFTEILKPLDLAPFQAFTVRSRETVVKRAFLILLDENSNFNFQLGELEITPFTRAAHTPTRWEKWDSMKITIEQGDLDSLAQAKVQLDNKGGRYVTLVAHTKPTLAAQDAVKSLGKT